MTTYSTKALASATSAHYQDSHYYDRRYARRTDDVRFYTTLTARATGPILELGAGTGRVTLALARAGRHVFAIEHESSMVTKLKKKLEAEAPAVQQRVRVLRKDLRTLKLTQRFSWVIAPFNVFMHLYSRQDIERALKTAHLHLEPRGKLAFDVLMPDLKALSRDPQRDYRLADVKLAGSKLAFKYSEAFDYDAISQIQMVTMRFIHPRDPQQTFITPLAHRQFFPAELETLLHYNHFKVAQRFGDFHGSHLSDQSLTQIVIAQPLQRQPLQSRRKLS